MTSEIINVITIGADALIISVLVGFHRYLLMKINRLETKVQNVMTADEIKHHVERRLTERLEIVTVRLELLTEAVSRLTNSIVVSTKKGD